jgi:hypothetical protein
MPARSPVDLCYPGVGENCQLAFNDKPVVDFDDGEVARIQQGGTCKDKLPFLA